MSDYNKHYQQPDYFGRPYPELEDFFKNLPRRGKVLDLGCGQGRDAIAIAELGFNVTGVDKSSVGIDQMITKAKKDNLTVTGVVANIYDYDWDNVYDIILLDSILHFQKRDLPKETRLLIKVAQKLPLNGILCIVIHESTAKQKTLKEVLEKMTVSWKVLRESEIEHTFTFPGEEHDNIAQFYMLILEKNE